MAIHLYRPPRTSITTIACKNLTTIESNIPRENVGSKLNGNRHPGFETREFAMQESLDMA
jgi:hypothetical protein